MKLMQKRVFGWIRTADFVQKGVWIDGAKMQNHTIKIFFLDSKTTKRAARSTKPEPRKLNLDPEV